MSGTPPDGAAPGGRGRVVLVGAGPGDPGLLTRRGAEALARADAVLHDQLLDPRMLELAPPEALRINVGKRGHDAPTRSQDEINALLVKLAHEGRTVVRLKGGDPFVFGRGGEEATVCAEAGVPVEVVPGVSSALAVPAAAGIPVTDRRHAASFAVVTGHKDPTRVREGLRWDLLATAVDTLVILMGMHHLEEITARLVAAGRAADTPSAAVMWGTTARQRTVTAPLSELAGRVREAGLGAPAVVVVGEVVRLHGPLAVLGWWERLPLAGRRVLVTRARGQAAALAEAVRAAGGEPVCVPMIRIVPVADPGPVDAALDALDGYDALVFASANAVRHWVARARERGRPPVREGQRVACVGARTAEAARQAGLRVDRVPDDREDGEGLARALLADAPAAGRRFLLPRSEIGRDALPRALRAAGGHVDAVAVYRTLGPDADAASLCRRLAAGGLDALTFTSPSTVHHFMAILTPEAREGARRCVVAAIGPTTAAALREAGWPPDVVPDSPSPEALVAALAGAFAGSSGGAPADVPEEPS